MKGSPDKPDQEEPQESKLKKWLKRIGLAGFLFFLIKGLIWLAVFMGAGTLLKECG